jgi:threonine dehydratase
MIASAKEVEEARELLGRYLRPTRLVSAESLARRSGARVYLKIESDLPTGSFKRRGALNALLTTVAQRALPGVVAASTGNHGAAVAYAAHVAKIGATIFLPENPNPVKRARIVALGAKVVERGAMGQTAASEGAVEFARKNGHYFLDDASDPLVPAGTATIASEILDEIPAPDVIFVPMGDTAAHPRYCR